jgi:hypothetical protein
VDVVALPKTTKAAPESTPFGSAFRAPTIRSAMPSPLTSPAPLTERPEASPAEAPFITKPPVPASTSESSTVVVVALPKTTKEAPESVPFGSSLLAPMIRSARPSPLTSPAPLTELPA